MRVLQTPALVNAAVSRWTPYGASGAFKCIICKQQLHQEAKYCQSCAYKKGDCDYLLHLDSYFFDLFWHQLLYPVGLCEINLMPLTDIDQEATHTTQAQGVRHVWQAGAGHIFVQAVSDMTGTTILTATSLGSPAATPPSASASMAIKTYAGPLPLGGVVNTEQTMEVHISGGVFQLEACQQLTQYVRSRDVYATGRLDLQKPAAGIGSADVTCIVISKALVRLPLPSSHTTSKKQLTLHLTRHSSLSLRVS
eukprot:SM000051S17592  [mRNA]  locus=s51:534102:538052:- [translate_table: standard]